MVSTYFMWVSSFEGVISEAKGYPTEEAMRDGLSLFVKEYLGRDVADSDVTGFKIDLVSGETQIIPADRAEIERLVARGRAR